MTKISCDSAGDVSVADCVVSSGRCDGDNGGGERVVVAALRGTVMCCGVPSSVASTLHSATNATKTIFLPTRTFRVEKKTPIAKESTATETSRRRRRRPPPPPSLISLLRRFSPNFSLFLFVLLLSTMCGCGANRYVRHSSFVDDELTGEDFLFGVGQPSYRTLRARTTTTEATTVGTSTEDYLEDDGDDGVPGRGRRHLANPMKWSKRLMNTNDTCLMTRKGEYLIIHPDGRVKGTKDLAVAWQRCEYYTITVSSQCTCSTVNSSLTFETNFTANLHLS